MHSKWWTLSNFSIFREVTFFGEVGSREVKFPQKLNLPKSQIYRKSLVSNIYREVTFPGTALQILFIYTNFDYLILIKLI